MCVYIEMPAMKQRRKYEQQPLDGLSRPTFRAMQDCNNVLDARVNAQLSVLIVGCSMHRSTRSSQRSLCERVNQCRRKAKKNPRSIHPVTNAVNAPIQMGNHGFVNAQKVRYCFKTLPWLR